MAKWLPVDWVGEKSFFTWYSGDDRRRNYIRTEQGQVIGFVVQLESYIAGRWHHIVRYDTAHGFAHRDLMHPDGRREKTSLPVTMDYRDALAYAIADIDQNWRRYKEAYRKEAVQ